jgi:hypothetical protein
MQGGHSFDKLAPKCSRRKCNYDKTGGNSWEIVYLILPRPTHSLLSPLSEDGLEWSDKFAFHTRECLLRHHGLYPDVRRVICARGLLFFQKDFEQRRLSVGPFGQFLVDTRGKVAVLSYGDGGTGQHADETRERWPHYKMAGRKTVEHRRQAVVGERHSTLHARIKSVRGGNDECDGHVTRRSRGVYLLCYLAQCKETLDQAVRSTRNASMLMVQVRTRARASTHHSRGRRQRRARAHQKRVRQERQRPNGPTISKR